VNNLPYVFVSALIALDLAASAAYLVNGDLRRAVYWAAAATLTICVTL
jgi:hypothetical protein